MSVALFLRKAQRPSWHCYKICHFVWHKGPPQKYESCGFLRIALIPALSMLLLCEHLKCQTLTSGIFATGTGTYHFGAYTKQHFDILTLTTTSLQTACYIQQFPYNIVTKYWNSLFCKYQILFWYPFSKFAKISILLKLNSVL